MAAQNSLNAPLPLSVANGGTGNSTGATSVPWTTVTPEMTGITLAKSNGYIIAPNAFETLLNMPAAPAIGDTFYIQGYSNTAFTISPTVFQTIFLSDGTFGTSGQMLTPNISYPYAALTLVCVDSPAVNPQRFVAFSTNGATFQFIGP